MPNVVLAVTGVSVPAGEAVSSMDADDIWARCIACLYIIAQSRQGNAQRPAMLHDTQMKVYGDMHACEAHHNTEVRDCECKEAVCCVTVPQATLVMCAIWASG